MPSAQCANPSRVFVLCRQGSIMTGFALCAPMHACQLRRLRLRRHKSTHQTRPPRLPAPPPLCHLTYAYETHKIHTRGSNTRMRTQKNAACFCVGAKTLRRQQRIRCRRARGSGAAALGIMRQQSLLRFSPRVCKCRAKTFRHGAFVVHAATEAIQDWRWRVLPMGFVD